jgi:very-short-patch-repair endonuclease
MHEMPRDDLWMGRRAFAQRMRRSMNFPERLLWSRLRCRRLGGLRFRRQHPIGLFTADFACLEHRVVVEVDGWSHQSWSGDRRRDAIIASMGWRVVRVANSDVVRDLGRVLATIEAAAHGHTPRVPFVDEAE